MKCTLFSIIVLLCSHMALAQILNIEKSVLDRDTTKKFIGNINGNLLL